MTVENSQVKLKSDFHYGQHQKQIIYKWHKIVPVTDDRKIYSSTMYPHASYLSCDKLIEF